MRKALLLATLLAALSALAGTGIFLRVGTRFEFTDCASGGSAAQTMTQATYLLRITDADTWLCFADSASTCATGGEKFPVGTVLLMTMPAGGQSVSCRSTASTGDAIFTRAD